LNRLGGKPWYRGYKVLAVSLDYAEYVKFRDTWLPARPAPNGALAPAKKALRIHSSILIAAEFA
jgi:nitrate reductase alpha subunit